MRRHLILVTVAVLCGVGLAAAIAYATIPGSGGVYTACMSKATGKIRLIDPSLPSRNLKSHCTSPETEITWNQVGPKGDTGAIGPQGPQGATGPQGPKGDPGEALVGSACSLPSGASGTVAMQVAADGGITLTCQTGSSTLCTDLPSYAHATTLCDPATGALSLRCDSGYQDSDGQIEDGCESQVGPGPVSNCTVDPSWPAQRDDVAADVLQFVNQDRASVGLEPLAVDTTLTASAVWKAAHMAEYEYFSHDDPAPPLARTWYQRVSNCGYDIYTPINEIMEVGQTTDAQAIVDAWLADATHRAIIEDARYAATGIGVAVEGDGAVVVVEDFGGTLLAPVG